MNQSDRPNLAGFRDYLLVLAKAKLPKYLLPRLDASDVVQECLEEANRAYSQFRGSSEAELRAWLCTIFANRLKHAVRDNHTQKRNISKERSLEDEFEESSTRLAAFLAADEPTPSAQAMHNEQLELVASAMWTLTPEESSAITLRYVKGWNQLEIADWLGKTRPAVAGYISRGLKKLRKVVGAQL